MSSVFVTAARRLALAVFITVVSLPVAGVVDFSELFTASTSSPSRLAPRASIPAAGTVAPTLPPPTPTRISQAVAPAPLTAAGEPPQEDATAPAPTPTMEPTPAATLIPTAIPAPVVAATGTPTPAATPVPTATPTPQPTVVAPTLVATSTPQPTVVTAPRSEPTAIPYTPARTDGLDYAYARSVGAVINQIRYEQGLSQLRIEPKLQKAAELYVEFLHSGVPLVDVPDVKYPVHYYDGSPYTRAVRQGYEGRVAEVTVISRGGWSGVPTPDRSARSWLTSPDHAAVILDPSRKDLGVGCFQAVYTELGDGAIGMMIMCIAELAVPF